MIKAWNNLTRAQKLRFLSILISSSGAMLTVTVAAIIIDTDATRQAAALAVVIAAWAPTFILTVKPLIPMGEDK